MKLRDGYKFESLGERNLVIASVLDYFAEKVNAKDVDYTQVAKYKAEQVMRMLGNTYNISPSDLMMYLTLPVGVEDINEKPNFGIRTSGELPNGRINMHLTNRILQDSLFGNSLQDKLFDDELGEITKVINSDDYLDYIATSLLKEPALLYYLFFTGRGEEFNRIFNDPDLLKSFEDSSFNGDEVVHKMTGFQKRKENGSQLLKDFVKKDNMTIEIIMNKSNTVPEVQSQGPVKSFN